MAVKKISPKNPVKASTAKGGKKADERKTATNRNASRKAGVTRNTMTHYV